VESLQAAGIPISNAESAAMGRAGRTLLTLDRLKPAPDRAINVKVRARLKMNYAQMKFEEGGRKFPLASCRLTSFSNLITVCGKFGWASKIRQKRHFL
jgi:hypothetical protein